jgi:two-component system, OmpR family, response regulator
MRILAIEDNRPYLDLMRSHLAKHGFTVDTAETLADGLVLARAGEHDVILLDLGLPDGDGAAVIEELRRRQSPIPVIVLTARGAILDRISLLDTGADDYIVKPVDFDELVARIRAVARRGPSRRQERLAFANLVFDRQSRQAIIDGRPIALRPREATLLDALLRRAGEPVHRDLLLSSIYSLDEEIGSNTLDVHVHHLRRRLAEAGARVSIATVRGHGYALRGHDA